MKSTITALKQAVVKILPGTEEANITAVLKAMHDPTCLVIQRQTEEAEEEV